MAELILITGGGRSGKSAHALQLGESFKRRVFIATAEAFDEEMRQRIARHKAERGADWETVEAPLELARAIRRVEGPDTVIVVDCLTVWFSNVTHYFPEMTETAPAYAALLDTLAASKASRIILVTNEVGMGIIPDNAMARRFRDMAGRLNQRIASLADRVILMVCGQALVVKGEKPQ